MSVATPQGGTLAVKKTRAVNPARKDKDAPNPLGRAQKKAVATTTSSNLTESKGTMTAASKKIKINLITQSRREEKEKAAKEKVILTQNGAASGKATPAKATTPTEVAADPFKFSAVAGGVSSGASATFPSPLNSNGVQPTIASPDPRQIPLPASVSSPLTPARNMESIDEFVHFQPEGPTPVPAAREGTALTWVAPNTVDTPVQSQAAINYNGAQNGATPNMGFTLRPKSATGGPAPLFKLSPSKRADLPVFTSVSTIRFAPATSQEKVEGYSRPLAAKRDNGPAVTVKQEPMSPPSIWDIPETPMKQ